jgi:hypothetical protein
MASSRWTWNQSEQGDGRYVSMRLEKSERSIVVAFPRPASWLEDQLEDHRLVRALLIEAVGEPWLPPPSKC